jgi:hypothetical protein
MQLNIAQNPTLGKLKISSSKEEWQPKADEVFALFQRGVPAKAWEVVYMLLNHLEILG